VQKFTLARQGRLAGSEAPRGEAGVLDDIVKGAKGGVICRITRGPESLTTGPPFSSGIEWIHSYRERILFPQRNAS